MMDLTGGLAFSTSKLCERENDELDWETGLAFSREISDPFVSASERLD
jgi:hypothetical protein